MQLRNILRDDCLIPNHRLRNKKEALRFLAERASASPALSGVSQDAIWAGLKERESLGSTGFGNGVAIPHCRLPKVKEFVVGIVTVPDGVDFEAMDGKPVRVIVFIVAPDNASVEHVRLLSRISQGLLAPGIFNALVSATKPSALRETLIRSAEPVEEKNGNLSEPKVLLHALVHNEDQFSEILTVLNSVEYTRLAVLDYDSGERYLQHMPLFSAFWSDVREEKRRMIVAVLHKRLVNETIRRLERQIGNLNQAKDVMIMVQDLFFCAGGLTE